MGFELVPSNKGVSVANRNPSGPEQNAAVDAGQEVSSAPAGKTKYTAPALIHLDARRTEGKASFQTFEGGSYPTTHGPS